MEVHSFDEIETEFIERVFKIVWCNVATVDTKGRPRSRILHPIWEGKVGWIGTRPTSAKAKHLQQNPYVSLAYVGDIALPVYADCKTEWVDDLAERQRIWDLYKSAPAPMGYDPLPIFGSLEGFGLLKLTPWRIEVASLPAKTQVWHQPEEQTP